MKTSVALCSYNGEKYIFKQLESIVNQTKRVDEIIICDDGSDDQTISIIEKFSEKKDVNIRIYNNSHNLGYIRNFEKAISLCSGDIIFLADQDDIWMPQKVEVVLNYFTTNPHISYVFTNALLINESDVESYDRTLFETVGMNEQNKKIFDQGRVLQVLSTGGRVTGATTAIRSSFVPYCLPFDYVGRVHDEMLAVTAAIWGKLGYIDQCLIKYRLHPYQSVGLTALFLAPPQSWANAVNLLMWHENLIEPFYEDKKKHMKFLHKRFWAIRSFWGIIKITRMFIRGEYKKYHQNYFYVWRDDVCCIIKRRFTQLLRLRKLEIVINDSLGLK